jgi:hypothetical protein
MTLWLQTPRVSENLRTIPAWSVEVFEELICGEGGLAIPELSP